MSSIRRARDLGAHFVHAHLFALVVATYVLAAVVPGPGRWMRGVSFGTITLFGQAMRVSLPMAMLAFLLANAGLGVRVGELGRLARAPGVLGAGLAANLVVPIAFIFAVSGVMQSWHNWSEVQTILVGLALVASMPIAGSSTAWSQNGNGDLALSLGLVVLSTVLSPFTTPLALHAVGAMAQGEYARALHTLAENGAGSFLELCVFLPAVGGILTRLAVGEARIAAVQPTLKLANAITLLLLNYSNAATVLPQVVAHPDYDFLAVILLITGGLCLTAFGAGWLVARLLDAGPNRRTSLMFGLGMNNNGTGLVLASVALANNPQVLIPILVYNLVQHVVAGLVHARLDRPAPGQPRSASSFLPSGRSTSSRPVATVRT